MLYFVNNAIGRSGNRCRRQHRNLRRHKVGGRYCAQSDSIIIGTAVTHNAYAAHIGQSGKILAGTLAQRQLVHLFAVDGVGVLHNSHLLRRYVANNADCQARSREGLACYQMLRQAQLTARLTHFILKQVAQRLDNLFEVYEIRQAAYVMMALNRSGFASQAAFHHVGVNRALRQIIHSADFLRFFLKYADKFLADNFTLLLRLAHACQLIVKALARVHADEVNIKLTALAKYGAYLLALVFTQQAVVDKYAGQLLADGFRQHSGAYAGIHAAG